MTNPIARALLVALVAAALPGCATSSVPKPIRNYAICVRDDVAPKVESANADVELALAGGNFVALVGIAKNFALSMPTDLAYAVVDCAVQAILPHAQARLEAVPTDPLSQTSVDTAKRWLRDHGGQL